MRVVISIPTKFHLFNVIRELDKLDVSLKVFSERPKFFLRNENLPLDKFTALPGWLFTVDVLRQFFRTNVPFQSWMLYNGLRSFDKRVAKRLPECEIFHSFHFFGLESAKAAHKKGAKWVCESITGHHVAQEQILEREYAKLGIPYQKHDPRQIAYSLESYEEADVILCASDFAERSFVEQGIPHRKIKVIPYASDISAFYPENLSLDSTKFRVLFVGGLSVTKGLYYLLRAIDIAQIPNCEVILAGQTVTETAVILNAVPNVQPQIIGQVSKDQLRKLYNTCDVFVLPSVQDGFGIVISEALACGCPVIASTNTGGQNVIRDSHNGFVVQAGDEYALAEKLIWLFENREARYQMRKNAVSPEYQAISWVDYANKLLALYQSIC